MFNPFQNPQPAPPRGDIEGSNEVNFRDVELAQ
jgi:hypothetical protein